MKSLLLIALLLPAMACTRGAIHELYEGAPRTAASRPKPVPDPVHGVVPIGPAMSFHDEFSGLSQDDLVERYGPWSESSILEVAKVNLVCSHRVLGERLPVIKQLGGKVVYTVWVQGEWRLDAYFWPESKTCIGSIRWNTALVNPIFPRASKGTGA